MQTGFRPGGRDFGFGHVTPRLIDLLSRTRTWAKLVALIAFLGVAALTLLAAVIWFKEDDASASLVVLGAGAFATMAFFLAAPLYRFASAVEDMSANNRTRSVAEAFESLHAFWSRAGWLTAVLLVLSVAGIFYVRHRAETDPGMKALLEGSLDPTAIARQQEEAEQAQSLERSRDEALREEQKAKLTRSPMVLQIVEPEDDTPTWAPASSAAPAAPGRTLGFEDLAQACQVADTTFLCLPNQPGETIKDGTRLVVTGNDAPFTILPQQSGERQLLEIAAQIEGEERWVVRLAPPEGFTLSEMAYENTSRAGDSGGTGPLLSVAGPSQSYCGGGGKFRVMDLAWGADGIPDRLVVDFDVSCHGGHHVGRLAVQAGGV